MRSSTSVLVYLHHLTVTYTLFEHKAGQSPWALSWLCIWPEVNDFGTCLFFFLEEQGTGFYLEIK